VRHCAGCEVESQDAGCWLCGGETTSGTLPMVSRSGHGDYRGVYEVEEFYVKQFWERGGVV
jgi:hypothetical protein